MPLTALHGRDRIDHELGRGGMATVYLAHDLKRPSGPRCFSLGSGLQSAYVAYVQGRVFALAGEPGRAVERLAAVLAVPAQVSRASFRIDRSLAPLRADSGFQSLIADR